MTVKLREYGEDSCEIVGSLNGREVICLTFSEGEWTVDMSRNLPLKLADAREHIAVFNVVLAEADRWQELRG